MQMSGGGEPASPWLNVYGAAFGLFCFVAGLLAGQLRHEHLAFEVRFCTPCQGTAHALKEQAAEHGLCGADGLAQRLRPTLEIPTFNASTAQPRSTLACSQRIPVPLVEAMHDGARRALAVHPCNCTVIVHHHLRKCAGVALRSTFEAHARALRQQPEAFVCPNSLQPYVARWRQQPPPPSDSPTLFVWEKHCGAHELSKLLKPVANLLRTPEALHGCQLFSFTMLRDPIRLIESDYFYFVNDFDHINVSLMEFAELNTEALLFEGTTISLGVPLPAPEPAAPPHLHELYARLRSAVACSENAAHNSTLQDEKAAWLDEQRSRRRAMGGGPLLVPKLGDGPWARERLLAIDALAARSAYVRAMKAAGQIECAAVAQAVVAQLNSSFDLVAVSERLAETLVLLADEVGLRALPPIGSTNSIEHPTLPEGSAGFRRLAELNTCSLLVYDTVRAAFDARVAALGEPFEARAAEVAQELNGRRGCGQLLPKVKFATINATPKQIAAGVPDGRYCASVAKRAQGKVRRRRGGGTASAALGAQAGPGSPIA